MYSTHEQDVALLPGTSTF